MTTTTTSWTNAAGGDFDDGSNWSNGVPQPGDTALITLTGTTVTVNSASGRSVGILQMLDATLDINGGLPFLVTAGTGKGTGALAGIIDINNGSSLVLGTDGKSTTFNNTGQINFNTTGNETSLVIAGKVTLAGTGNVTLGDPVHDQIVSDGTAATLTNGSTKSGNRISGTGIIGDATDNLLTFVNGAKGIINANSAAGLLIDPDGGTVTNNGLIEVTGAGELTLGGGSQTTTVNNAGTIAVNPEVNSLVIGGPVTLGGKGRVDLGSGGSIVSNRSAVTLTNNSTISGAGTIGDSTDALLSFTNGAKGIVNATGDLAILTNTATVTNDGLMEATGAGILQFQSDVSQIATGKLKANSGGTVELGLITVTGGAVSVAKGSTLDAVGDCSISTGTTAIANAGTIDAVHTHFSIASPIKNTSTGTLTASSAGVLDISGAVTGGTANITESGSAVIFRAASSANVAFGSGAGELLELFDATQFTGTVAGLSANPNAAIDLENIPFNDITAADVNYLPAKHDVTAFDPVTHVTDTIKIAGTLGMVSVSLSSDGTSTSISDPPANPTSGPHANTSLLAQSMAAFGSGRGVTGSGSDKAAELHTGADFLAASAQHSYHG